MSTAELVGAQINNLKTVNYKKVYEKHEKLKNQYPKRHVGYRSLISNNNTTLNFPDDP